MSDPDDVMFSPSVKAEQTRLGSRAMFEDREWKTEITDDLRQFLGVIDTFFLATASADGRPYIQHRGGPPGFLKTIGTHTLAFADFAGNRQYITLGHLKENDSAHIFILHFATQQRVKLWGRARVVENDLELMERLVDPAYKAQAAARHRLHARSLGHQLPAAHRAALQRRLFEDRRAQGAGISFLGRPHQRSLEEEARAAEAAVIKANSFAPGARNPEPVLPSVLPYPPSG